MGTERSGHAPSTALALACAVGAGACSLAALDGLSGGPEPPADSPEAGPLRDAGDAGVPAEAGPCSETATEPGLVAHYSFDEGAGTEAHDCSGARHVAQIVSGGWTAGLRGAALKFDGSSTCVDLGPMPELPRAGAFSVVATVNVTDYASLSYPRFLVSRTNDAINAGFWLGTDAAQVFELRLGQPSSSLDIVTSSQPSSAWLHVAAVYAPGTRAEIYVGGKLAKSGTNVPAALVDDPSANVRLGCKAGSNYFKGLVDDLRIYGRALDASEIAALAQ